MPKLRVLSGQDVLRILDSFGFLINAQRGSHVKVRRLLGRTSQNGRNVDVPVFGFFSYGSICRKIEAWLLLLKFHPASASSPPNWLNRNPCAAARFPNASSSAARRAALAPAIPRPATVLTRA